MLAAVLRPPVRAMHGGCYDPGPLRSRATTPPRGRSRSRAPTRARAQEAARRRGPPPGAAGKDQPLVDDIRLLGRILGDVIREQEGKAGFELVERVRQPSVAFRLGHDARSGAEQDGMLGYSDSNKDGGVFTSNRA